MSELILLVKCSPPPLLKNMKYTPLKQRNAAFILGNGSGFLRHDGKVVAFLWILDSVVQERAERVGLTHLKDTIDVTVQIAHS